MNQICHEHSHGHDPLPHEAEHAHGHGPLPHEEEHEHGHFPHEAGHEHGHGHLPHETEHEHGHLPHEAGHEHGSLLHEAGQAHGQGDKQGGAGKAGGPVLTVRSHSGLSGDMMLTGLARMLGVESPELNEMAAAILPELGGSVEITHASVHGIGGWRTNVALPHAHEKRSLADIVAIVDSSQMEAEAKSLALEAFRLLAQAEGRVHGLNPDQVHFHEVGALDSILDIGLCCALFAKLGPSALVLSPLPVCDGHIRCMHGTICAPAPAVLELLEGMAVVPFEGVGETITPTAAALVKTFHASFGPWPAMRVAKTALVYGTKVFEGVPNGAVFALGQSL